MLGPCFAFLLPSISQILPTDSQNMSLDTSLNLYTITEEKIKEQGK